MRCPSCDRWAERRDWRDAPLIEGAEALYFHIVCPHCARDFDVGEPEYRLYRPEDVKLTHTERK